MSRVAKGYDWLSWQYGFWEAVMFGRGLKVARLSLLNDWLRDNRPEDAWVLGDGTGHVTRCLLHEPPTRVLGIDISPRMLKRQRSAAEELNAEELWRGLQMDLRKESSELPASSLDLIAAAFSFDCLSEVELNRLLNRLDCCLAVDGWLYVVDFVPVASLPKRYRPLHAMRSWLMHRAFRIVSGHPNKRLLDWRQLLRNAGWTEHQAVMHFNVGAVASLWRKEPPRLTS